jgi:methionine-gamma-lyase
MKNDQFDSKGFQTRAVHSSNQFNKTKAVSPPIWQTTTFYYDSAEEFADVAVAFKPDEFYTRYGNPTHTQVEATLAALEGGQAVLLTGSGMGAVFASIMSHLEKGDHIIAQQNHYAGTSTLLRELLQRWGIEHTVVDQTDIKKFEDAIKSNTKLIFAESPTNPLMQITDLRALSDLGRKKNIKVIVDNTFATPINQRPLDFGVDAVLHSATKYLGGHHDLTAGAVIGSKEFVERAWKFALVTGATLSPFDGWLLLRGLRTLGLRVERHNQNGLAIARFLESNPKIKRVYYPGLESHPQHKLAFEQMSGFTGVLSVEFKDGFKAAERFISSLKLAMRAASLGGFETLVVHPAAMWGLQVSEKQREETGISESLVRISVGLEDEKDLIDDFTQALAKI